MGATTQLVFLRALARFGFEELALFFGANARLISFEFANLFQLSFMRRFGGGKLSINLGTARLFHGVHSFQFFFDPCQLSFGNTAPRFLGGTFARLSFNAQLFLFGAVQRRFFLLLPPTLRLLIERVFGGQSHCFEFCAAGLFVSAHTGQLGFKLPDFLCY